MTPEQEEQVRRALAATAAHEDSSMPPEVAARLQGVLSELVAPRSGAAQPEDSGRDELAARRRRRWPQVLAAAAAVSVIGLGGTAVVTGWLTGQPDSTTAGRASTQADDGRADSAEGAGEGAGEGGGRGGDQKALVPSEVPDAFGEDGSPAQDATTPRLRTATLARDVKRVLGADPSPSTVRGRRQPGTTPEFAPEDGAAASCAVPVTRRGDRLLAVRLDGRAATLVLGPVREGTREARVYSCDRADAPLARTVVRP